MSETINTTIYNDNIQSLTSNNITLYTNKLNGQITLGNTNVPVSMNNVSLNNLSVINIDNINNINVSFLNVNNINCIQPSETRLYFNSNNIITTTIPSSTTGFATILIGDAISVPIDFTIDGNILKNFKGYIITTNLFCSIISDISSQVQYRFDISRNGVSLLTSNLSDDINDLSLNNVVDPSSCICNFYAHNFLDSVIDGETYTVRLTFITSPNNVAGKRLFMYYNSLYPSYISFVNNYNVGYYNNTIKNNYIFSNPSAVINSVLSTSSSNDTVIFSASSPNVDVSFGLPMYLSVGVWNIEMYTTIVTTVATTYVYLILSYKNSVTPSTVYDTIPFYEYSGINGSQLPIKISSTLVITTANTYVTPFLRTITGCTTPLTFKTVNTFSGQPINTASGYNITRIA